MFDAPLPPPSWCSFFFFFFSSLTRLPRPPLLPPKDILANLFKLQIGAQKHWNVYTHSFLQFGLNSARARMHTKVTDAAKAEAAEGCVSTDRS